MGSLGIAYRFTEIFTKNKSSFSRFWTSLESLFCWSEFVNLQMREVGKRGERWETKIWNGGGQKTSHVLAHGGAWRQRSFCLVARKIAWAVWWWRDLLGSVARRSGPSDSAGSCAARVETNKYRQIQGRWENSTRQMKIFYTDFADICTRRNFSHLLWYHVSKQDIGENWEKLCLIVPSSYWV